MRRAFLLDVQASQFTFQSGIICLFCLHAKLSGPYDVAQCRFALHSQIHTGSML